MGLSVHSRVRRRFRPVTATDFYIIFINLNHARFHRSLNCFASRVMLELEVFCYSLLRRGASLAQDELEDFFCLRSKDMFHCRPDCPPLKLQIERLEWGRPSRIALESHQVLPFSTLKHDLGLSPSSNRRVSSRALATVFACVRDDVHGRFEFVNHLVNEMRNERHRLKLVLIEPGDESLERIEHQVFRSVSLQQSLQCLLAIFLP